MSIHWRCTKKGARGATRARAEETYSDVKSFNEIATLVRLFVAKIYICVVA